MQINSSSFNPQNIENTSTPSVNHKLIQTLVLQKALNFLSRVLYEESERIFEGGDSTLDPSTRKLCHIKHDDLTISYPALSEKISKHEKFYFEQAERKLGRHFGFDLWQLNEEQKFLIEEKGEILYKKML